MRILSHALVCVFALLLPVTAWASNKDPRLMKITAQELRVLMSRTPLDAQRQALLLSRADRWGLQELAYQLAKQQAQAHPKSADAQFLYGLAAREYAENRFFSHKGSNSVALFDSLLPVIREQLSKSQSMNPKSALFDTAYGFWLWQLGGDMKEGLRLVQQARSLDSHHVGTIASLGAMYSNPSGNCYDPKKAERALRLATQLDPSYAYPKWTLMNLLYTQRRYAEAKQQLNAFLSVVPEDSLRSPEVLQWKTLLAKA